MLFYVSIFWTPKFGFVNLLLWMGIMFYVKLSLTGYLVSTLKEFNMEKDEREKVFVQEIASNPDLLVSSFQLAHSRFNGTPIEKPQLFKILHDAFKVAQSTSVCYTNDVIRKAMYDHFGGEWAVLMTFEPYQISYDTMRVFLQFRFPNNAQLVIAGNPDMDVANMRYENRKLEL